MDTTDEENAWQFTQEGCNTATRALVITPLPIDAVLRADIAPSLDDFEKRHPLAGLVINTHKPIILFRLPESVGDDVFDYPLGILTWGWTGKFGGLLTLTGFFTGTKFVTRATIPRSNDEALSLISHGIARAVFVRGKRLIRAFEFDFNSNPIAIENLRFHVAGVRDKEELLVDDEAAHYWEVIKAQSILEASLTPTDYLCKGWFEDYKKNVVGMQRWMADLFQNSRIPPITDTFPPRIRGLIQAIASESATVDDLLGAVKSIYTRTENEFVDLMRDCLSWGRDEQKTTPEVEWREAVHFVFHAVSLFMRSSEQTNCGKRVMWYDHRNDCFRFLDLDASGFPVSSKPELYWSLVPWTPFNHGFGIGVAGNDFPIDPKILMDVSKMPIADDPALVSGSADALLDEAESTKIGTIPPRAIVDLHFGPFQSMELTECFRHVFITCRTATNEYFQISIEPAKHYCSFSIPTVKNEQSDMTEKLEAGVKLLLCAVIRDFWVVENRDTVFAARLTTPNQTQQRRLKDDRPRIVYVPRIHYTQRADVDNCAESLNHEVRRAHFVRGHFRRSDIASDHQLILAERYGFDVPEGYTFVRPHERGKAKRDIIYRSRSALQCMYSAETMVTASHPSRWFQFERDVNRLMVNLGFDVQHIAASKRGDNGIDVYATKGTDFDEVNWVIQCKCWKPSKRIYPSTVRELIGVLTGYPQGTRGMIITTSSFSSGATETANVANIRLVDGAEFVKLSTAT